MKRTFFSLALLLAVATLTAQTKMTAREAAVKIARPHSCQHYIRVQEYEDW